MKHNSPAAQTFPRSSRVRSSNSFSSLLDTDGVDGSILSILFLGLRLCCCGEGRGGNSSPVSFSLSSLLDGVDDVFVLGLLLGGFGGGGVLSAISSSTLVSSLVKKC